MKNFTNNFKQFTSRLSARWLIMALMLLVGTSSAWGVDKVIYITTGTSTGYSNPYIYVWNNSSNNSWPGKAMDSAGKTSEGYPVYKYTWTSEFSSFIVMDGDCGNDCKKTGDVSYSKTQSYIYNVKTGNWSSYTPTQSATFSFSLPELYVGTPATITYSLSPSNAGSVSFSCTTSNATISGNQITANSSGTVTVKATIKYNSGYSGTTTTSKSTTAYIPAETKLYLKPTGWTSDNAKFSAYFFTGTSNNQWKVATVVCNTTDVYEVELPSGKWTNLIWCRMDPNGNQTAWSEDVWGQTVDLTYEGKNLYTITNAYGCGDNKSCGDWSNYTPPSCCTTINDLNISESESTICDGESVTLTLNNKQSGVTYKIGETTIFNSNDAKPTYNTGAITGVSSKSYTIKATADNQCAPKEKTVTIIVNARPSAPSFPAAPSYCAGDYIELPVEDNAKNTVTWYTQVGSEVDTPLNTAGNHTYKAKATNADGCVSSDFGTYSYTVKSVPAVNDFEYTEPDNLTYDRSAKEASVTWESGTGSGDITIYYKVAGATDDTYTTDAPIAARTYTVAVTAIEGGNYCATTGYVVVGEFTINKANQTTPTITAESTDICGKEATFTVSGGESTGDYVYSFDKNDADVTIDGTTLKATQSGSVTLKVKKAQDANYNESAEVTKEFNFTMPIENVKLTKADSKTTYCTGDVVRIKLTYDGPTVTDINKFKWNGAVEGQVSITNVTGGMASGVEFDVTCISGENKISVALTDCSGEKPSNELEINVSPLPSAPTLTTNTTNVCPGTLTLSNFKAMAETNTVKWYSNDACTQEVTTPTPTVEKGKEYTFYAKAKNAGGCFSTDYSTLTVTVYDDPKAFTLTAIPTEICSGADVVISISNKQDGVTYKLGDTEISESIIVKPTSNTTYTVVASLDACPSLTNSITTEEITVNPIPSFKEEPLPTLGICRGTELNADLTYLALVEVENGSPVWYDAETGGKVVTEANLNNGGTYWVAAENAETGCVSPERKSFVVTINELPEKPTLGNTAKSVCIDADGTVNLYELAEVNNVVWYLDGKEVEKADAVSIATAGEFRYLAKAVDPITGCVSADGVEFTLTVNPLPTIALTADNDALSVGDTVTLTVTGNDFTSLTWSATDGTKSYTVTPGAGNTATITSNENAIVTVTVIATSANGCVATATKELTFGSEDCENANADYIEILCRRTDNPASTDAGRDMHCYAWDPNTDKTYLGGWPGVKTDDGDFEYKGKKYAVWQIKTNSDIYIIFSNGNDSQKTGDIKGPNDAGLKKGYRYVYTLSSDYKTATLYEDPSIIFAPEVKTLSATCARQSDNSLKVTVTGKIMKKGCAEISSYGFQYKKDGDDYTNDDVCSSNCDQDAGFIFTKDITLAAGKYGEYTFRARLINENSSKVYGEKITIYYSESDVLIAAVGDDEEVTNKSGVYYDFVGLYVKNVMLPEGAKVKSYKWYKGDAVYNGGNVTVADRGVSAANNNIRPSEAGLYKCVVTLDNNQTLTSNVINVTATDTYNDKVNASNRNLPVISVRTNVAFPTCATAGTEGKYPSTNIEGWKEKRSVDVKIFNADGTLYYDRKARMNYRGSSSLNFNKKSYAFCPGAANCGGKNGADYVKKEALNLFGLSGGAIDEDWVLYAAAADPTLMRNRLVFDTYAKMTGEWGVNSMFVELVIDGEYQGVYVLMDKITNNEKRVYVGTYGDDEKKDYNGGFIVKFDKTDVADRERNLVAGQEIGDEKTFMTTRTGRLNIDTYNTKVDQLFEIEYPEKGDVEDAKGNWSTVLGSIKQKFQDFENALEKGEFLKVRAMIDYKSWADWFIINEFTKNVDAYRASCVFTCEGEGHKIKAMPLWDQELSFNNEAGANISKKGANVTNGLLIENSGVYTDCFPAPFWFTGRTSNFNTCGTDGGESTEGQRLEYYLLKDECFIQTIKERWKIHIAKGRALHNETLTTKVGTLLTELGKAKSRETTKWPSDHRVADACGGPGTGYNKVTFDDSKEALDDWVGGELNADATSESSSYSRVTNLNYLINQMQGDPLQFNLVLNPGNGVTTPWVPVTLTVEAPAGYDYTYDDSEVEAAEGVIIKKLGNDAYSYTFPRPEAWGTGNDANASDPRDPRQYGVKVTLNVETVDNTCGTVDTEKHATITLEDEGDDNCSYTDK